MTRLPDTMSDLLELALDDMESLGPEYVLDMHEWHKVEGGLCHVCLAGAVMARSLGIKQSASPHCSGGENAKKLYAINAMREGDFLSAMEILDLPEREVQTSWHCAMAHDPITYMIDWRHVVAELREQGL